MKRVVVLSLMLLLTVSILSSFAFAADNSCNLGATLVSQDPYPAVPGDYVNLVFQVTGVSDPNCGRVTVQLMNKFPISFDPGASDSISVDSGFFNRDFSNYLMAPFKVKVDKDALNGMNDIQLNYSGSSDIGATSYTIKDFNLVVNSSETDFDVIVDSFSYSTGILTFDVLNKGKNNAEALTIEVPSQDGLTLKGTNKKVIGSLNSRDDTTVSFNAIPTGNQVSVNLEYNDLINERRTIEKNVTFDSAAFASTKSTGSAKSVSFYLLWITWIVVVVVLVYRYYKRKKAKKLEQQKRFR